MKLSEMVKKYSGICTFGQLVLTEYQENPMEDCLTGFFAAIKVLPSEVQKDVSDWVDETCSQGQTPSFWTRDSGEALDVITNASKKYFEKYNIQPTDEDLFIMFQIIVRNLAYTCHKDRTSRACIVSAVQTGSF